MPSAVSVKPALQPVAGYDSCSLSLDGWETKADQLGSFIHLPQHPCERPRLSDTFLSACVSKCNFAQFPSNLLVTAVDPLARRGRIEMWPEARRQRAMTIEALDAAGIT